MKYVIFRGDRQYYALPVSTVDESFRPLAMTTIHDSPVFVAGVSIIRGAPIPVIDLGILAAGTPLQMCKRAVVVRTSTGRKVCLLVSEVLGVVENEALSIHTLPPLLSSAEAETIQTLGQRDGELLSVLNLGRIVPETVWSTLQQGA